MHIITNNLSNSYGLLLLTGKKSFQESCDYYSEFLQLFEIVVMLKCGQSHREWHERVLLSK